MSCGFAGNSDVYGIGIRIGYYTQALAVWFANYFYYREARSLQAVNNIFLFALVIAGSIYAFNARTTFAVEAFLLLQIGLCMAFISIMETTRYSSKYMKTQRERLVMRTVVIYAGLLFNVCFWWRGLDIMVPTPCDSGAKGKAPTIERTYACYMIRANLYGWMRAVMKTLSLAGLAWITVTNTAHDAGGIVQKFRMKDARAEFVKLVSIFNQAGELIAVPGENIAGCAAAQGPEKPVELSRMVILETLETSTEQQPEQIAQGNQGQQSKDNAKSHQEQIISATQEPVLPQQQKISCQDESESNQKAGQGIPEKEEYIKLRKVREAEAYLDLVLSIYPKTACRTAGKYGLNLLGGWICIYVPTFKSQCDPQTSAYKACLYTLLSATWNNKPPRKLRISMAFYIVALGQHPMWRWPRFVDRMKHLNEKMEPPDERFLSVASDLQLSQMPFTVTAGIWTLMAAENLLVIIILIVQVELTISWNNVSGLQSLTTLGQLIPFVLGVGGLIKVIYGKWCLVKNGIKEDSQLETRHMGEYEVAIEKYLRWKDRQLTQPTAAAPRGSDSGP